MDPERRVLRVDDIAGKSRQEVAALREQGFVIPVGGGETVAPEAAPGVQPDPGQGEGGSGSGLYDLDAAPPELRPHLERELKKIEGNATKRFQEAAQYRQQWAPYEQLGVNQLPPEQVAQLLQFYSLTQDPEAFEDWWETVGEQMGFAGDPDDPDAEGEDDVQADPEEILRVVAQFLDQRLAPIQQRFQSFDEQQVQIQANDWLEDELDALQEEHGELDKDTRDAVLRLALAHDGPDAIKQGFADFQRITANGQRQLVTDKRRQPRPAERGGRPATGATAPTNFKDAQKLAMERMRQSGGS
jgi:hypothetical protein